MSKTWTVIPVIIFYITSPAKAGLSKCSEIFALNSMSSPASIKFEPKVNFGNSKDFNTVIFGSWINSMKIKIIQSANSTRYIFNLSNTPPGYKKNVEISFVESFASPLVAKIETEVDIPPIDYKLFRNSKLTFHEKRLLNFNLQKKRLLENLYLIANGDKANLDKAKIKNPNIIHEEMQRLNYLEDLELGKRDDLDPLLFLPSSFDANPVFVKSKDGQMQFGAAGFDIHYSLYGIYIRQNIKESTFPDPIENFIRVINQRSAILKLKDNTVGIGLHIDRYDGSTSVIYALSVGEMIKPEIPLSTQFYRLPFDVWRQVISIYRKRMKGYSKKDEEQDLGISKKLAGRSYIFTWSNDPNSSFTIPFFNESNFIQAGHRLPFNHKKNDYNIMDGALTAVVSNGSNETYPMEELWKIQLPRDHRVSIEIGRFAVARLQKLPISKTLLKLATAFANSGNNIGKVRIEADGAAHLSYYLKMGFKEIEKSEIFPSIEHIPEDIHFLEIEASDLLKSFS